MAEYEVLSNLPSSDTSSTLVEVPVGASPFVFTNPIAVGCRVFFEGGLVLGVEYQSFGWPQRVAIQPQQWIGVGSPKFIDINPLDVLRITYVPAFPPTIKYVGF